MLEVIYGVTNSSRFFFFVINNEVKNLGFEYYVEIFQ